MSRFKKTILVISIFAFLVFVFSSQTIGIRVFFPAWLVGTIRDFLADDSHLSIEPYKDGTIILIKPIATGVGEGRYEAGDIVEIRDGQELYQKFGPEYPFLGYEERTRLLPVYYDGKLSEEMKRMLMESEETKRRQYGIDYTQVLKDRQILKVRRMEKLDKLPEIDLSHIIEKAPEQLSAVQMPKHLALIENTRKSINQVTTKIAQTVVPPIRAQSESVKTVDTGGFADYSSLNAWESANEEDITADGSNIIAVAKCQHKTATSTADTTAVTIGTGWVTDSTHYIKVWTDPSEDHRHNGVWDTGKYRLAVTDNHAFYIVENYVRIEGLQIKITTTGNNYSGVYATSQDATAEIKVSESIVKGVISGTAFNNYGLYFGDSDITAKVYNNIIYDFKNGANSIMAVRSRFGGTGYFYNNTVYNCYDGFYNSDSTMILENNIAYNNTDNYDGSFSGDYNLSGPGTDAQMPGSNSRNGVEVLFVNASTTGEVRDLHLAYADTGAKGYGTDLSGDDNLAFGNDIDGQERVGDWDIGADEYQATEIYRSVGPNNSSPLANGWDGDTLSISAHTASFSTGLPTNVGVGDVIVYTATEGTTANATNSVAFIHGRTSSTQYTIKDVAGHMASTTMAATTRWAVYRAYESLSQAESGDENDGIEDGLETFESWSAGKNLASSTERWNIACYGDVADTTEVEVNNWTTTADNYIKIYTPTEQSEVGISQRHNGVWDEEKYRLEIGDGNALTIAADYTKIHGLQILINPTADYRKGINNNETAEEIEVAYNIVRKDLSSSSIQCTGINVYPPNSSDSYIYNNIVYDFDESGEEGIFARSADNYPHVYSNTLVNCTMGVSTAYGDAVVKNNIAVDCATGAKCFNQSSDAWGSGSDYNLSSDGTAPGSNSKTNTTVLFTDEANDDFHLSHHDGGARNHGTNLTHDANLAFSDDIDGTSRNVDKWDIGADEAIVYKAVVNTPITDKFTGGLVGHWTFNGQDVDWSTNTAYDRSGEGNNGAITNMSTTTSPTDGKIGQALEFDGSNDYVEVGLSSLSDFTITGWVNLHSSPPTNNGFFGAGSQNRLLIRETGYYFEFNDYPIQEPPNTASNVNTWAYIAVVRSGTTATYYRNATYIDAWDVGSGAVDFSNSWIGAQDFGPPPTYPFDGLIDEVRVYDRVLSAEEIMDLYRVGAKKLGVNTPITEKYTGGLVSHWTFNGQDIDWATNTAYDRSGEGNNGAITNMSTTTSPTDGKIGQALGFDGSNDYVQITDANLSANFPGKNGTSNTSFSAAFWLKIDTLAVNEAVLRKPGSWQIVAADSDTLQWGIVTDGGSSYLSNNTSLQSETWYHMIWTWDGSNMRVYLNGQDDGGPQARGNTLTDNTNPFNIGINATPSTGPFDGLIDEVRIYNQALSTTTIQDLYRAGARKFKF